MLKNLFEKYKDIIPYAFFGVCTTVVNTLAYMLCARTLEMEVVPSTIIAWFVAVLFAYLTNRKWVFHSEARTRAEIAREVLSFYSCRIATGVVDWIIMYIFVDVLQMNDLVIKIAANVVVIVLNYVASKVLIFKKKG